MRIQYTQMLQEKNLSEKQKHGIIVCIPKKRDPQKTRGLQAHNPPKHGLENISKTASSKTEKHSTGTTSSKSTLWNAREHNIRRRSSNTRRNSLCRNDTTTTMRGLSRPKRSLRQNIA